MRPGQNNKNRNRNRNRRHGGGNQGGGQGANRVYDSNGPDVKLRGTAHTIAEKYMQLARDAHSAGDNVMAENYYQFSDHYYRVWLAAQPVGQPIQFSRRNAEEEYDDDDNEIVAEAESENAEAETVEGGEQVSSEGDQPAEGEASQGNYQARNGNRNDRHSNRESNNRFRQRWPRRNDRYGQEGQPNTNGNSLEGDGQQLERFERPAMAEAAAQAPAVEPNDTRQWEAPSFLRRPVEAPMPVEAEADTASPRPRRGRPPRAAAPFEDAPQEE